jgi:DNA-binding GntR family transcriptional regulator
MLKAITQNQLTPSVYRQLRARIVGGAFAPGERLQPDQLAVQLRVSRTPVRDALNQLATEGLVEVRPRRGTFVARVDQRTVAELYQLRLMIDTFVGDLVVHALSRQQLRQIARVLERMATYVRGDTYTDYAAYLDCDRAFHSTLVRFAGNRRLVALYEEINLPLWLVRAQQAAGMAHSGDAGRSLDEHRAIYEALLARDPARVRQAMTMHLERGRSRVELRLDGHVRDLYPTDQEPKEEPAL